MRIQSLKPHGEPRRPVRLAIRNGAARLLLVGGVLIGGVAAHAAQVAEPPAVGASGQSAATTPSIAAIVAAMPKNLPRAAGPGLSSAIEAAEAAQQACAARGAKVSVLVADSAGAPIVLLSGDGAGFRSQLIARTKVAIVIMFKMASGDVKEMGKTHPQVIAAAAADPDIGEIREGGFPLMRDGKMIGAVGVSGGSLTGPHSLDEDCARVAVARLEGR